MKKKKRCLYCGEWFQPNPRTIKHQKACGKKSCKIERKRQAQKRWLKANPGYYKGRSIKVRPWAKEYPDYWQHYRLTHPEYTQKNRIQSCQRMRQRRQMFANKDAISNKPIEYLKNIQCLEQQNMFANKDTIAQKVEGILAFLMVKEMFAKQNDIVRFSG